VQRATTVVSRPYAYNWGTFEGNLDSDIEEGFDWFVLPLKSKTDVYRGPLADGTQNWG
jgi:hypothetical protein